MAYVTIDSNGVLSNYGDGNHQFLGTTNLTGSFIFSGSMMLGNTPHLHALTASAALSFDRGGMYILSSSTGAVTATVPDPGRVPGAKFIFRAGSAHAHVVTGSVGGFASFVHMPGIAGTFKGSKLALDGLQNASVSFESDGFHYVVLASSGTVTLSQT